MNILFTHIKSLLQIRSIDTAFVAGQDMQELPSLDNAYLLVEKGRIADFGTMDQLKHVAADEVIDARGKILLPAWCDAHTHIVFAGNREGEFVDRIRGMSYEEIAQKGGGILNSAKRLQATAEDDLYEQSKARLEAVIRMGTGAIEIKSGYGLTLASELNMLRVIKRLKETYPVEIKATFLGAHAIPASFKSNPQAYVDHIIQDMIPAVAEEQLAEYVDVFCEKGYFTTGQTDQILTAASQYGLIPKIHVNQFHAIGGVAVGVKHHALSVDHLEVLTASDLEALAGTQTMPVGLPGCSFFLGIPYTPARQIIDAGLPLALATDYNPGSAPVGNMNLMVAMGCIKMRMTPEEAINAATLNGAYAMGLEQEVGSITVGKQANLILTKPIHSYANIAYDFGNMPVEAVYIRGEKMILRHD